MAVNKVVYGNDTLMDITDTTATAEDVASGKVFYGANGTRTTGSASYTETDPIYSASAAATISSSDITNWNSKVGTTDYASASTGGVIKSANGLKINTSGTVFAEPTTYANYLNATDGLFIGKGTLENVITGKGLATADDLVVKTIDFTAVEQSLTDLKNLFDTYSQIASNEFDYDKKGLYKIIFTDYDEYITRSEIGTLHSGTYDPTGESRLEFDILPGGNIYDKDKDVTIKRVVLTLSYLGDGTSYDDIEDYSLNSYVNRVASQITVLDFVNSNNDEILKLFQTFGQTSLIDDYSNQLMKNYGLYNIIVPITPYSTTYTGVYFGTLIGGNYNETGASYLTFSVLSGGHNYQDDNIPSTGQLMVSYTYNNGSYTLSTTLHSNISTSIDSTSDDYSYPTSKAVYDFVTSQGGGGGSATDVQINGTSITSNGTANILTNTAYNASSNKIATMSDIPSLTNYVTNTDYASSSTGGVVKLSGYNGLAVNNSGNLYPTNNTYAEYQSAGDTWAISKGTLENVITGKGLITNTDYAGTTAAGVIMTASGAGTYTGATGILYSSAITYANYPSYSNNGFISKGTLENVITGKNLISTSGATMAGALVAQNNTNYTTKQVRNVVFSTSDPTSSDGGNGDIWIKYS